MFRVYVQDNTVSIPSQVGTLFGPIDRMVEAIPPASLNTLSGGHPLRTVVSGLQDASRLKRLNTLSGGHPLRTPWRRQVSRLPCSLNTLSGGHPLRTDWATARVRYGDPSQYPLRWAPSSDDGTMNMAMANGFVSIPSQVGTLFGRPRPTRRNPRTRVSIPSQVGTLFGPREWRRPAALLVSQYPLRWAPSSDQG